LDGEERLDGAEEHRGDEKDAPHVDLTAGHVHHKQIHEEL
jgi:hypothetical protein